MNPTDPKLLTDATEVELIDALGALWAKDYLANNEPAEVAEYVYDVNQGNGDMLEEDNRESQQDLWSAVHEAFFFTVAAHPEVAALVEEMEAEDAANRPPIDWHAEIMKACTDLAKAEGDRIKFPKDEGQINRVTNCQNALRMMIEHAAAAGFDPDGTPVF